MTEWRNKVLFTAASVGGAKAIAPIVNNWKTRGDSDILIVGTQSLNLIMSDGDLSIPSAELDSTSSDVIETFEQASPSIIITGTSVGLTYEKQLVRLARDSKRPIRTISIVDAWDNYHGRFSSPGSYDLGYMPDFVCVPDRKSIELAVSDGLPRDNVRATGQPYFSRIVNDSGEITSENFRNSLRSKWLGVRATDKSERTVVFASEKIEGDFPLGSSEHPGYTEFEALEQFTIAVEQIRKNTSFRFTVVLKLHPGDDELGSERVDRLMSLVPQDSILEHAASSEAVIRAADLIVGMKSTMLIEASILGMPTISIQPGVERADKYIGTTQGYVTATYDSETLADQIIRMLDNKNFQQELQPNVDELILHESVPNVIQLALSDKFLSPDSQV